MTNLQQLIERRQGAAKRTGYKHINNSDHLPEWYGYPAKSIDTLTAQTATEAYRQALEDVLAGLPGDDRPRVPENDTEEAWMSEYIGHNTALQTVRDQIEGLLSKIE